MKVEEWLDLHLISYSEVSSKPLILDISKFGKCLVLRDKDKVFDDELRLLLDEDEQEICEEVDFLIYKFGSCFYYATLKIFEKFELNILRNVGEPVDESTDFPYLGVHGKYELCNGSGEYLDWCKKAKFLGVETLGICEKNTLAGTLPFQLACKKSNINSILGETISVSYPDKRLSYDIKLYVKDSQGWGNLCELNTIVNIVSTSKMIEIEDLDSYNDGLSVVLVPISLLSLDKVEIRKVITSLRKHLREVFFQFDLLEFESNKTDKEYLELLSYLRTLQIPPLLISDSYYLEQFDSEIKQVLNRQGQVSSIPLKSTQHFRSLSELHSTFDGLFVSKEEEERYFKELVTNTQNFASSHTFKIDTENKYLAQYIMTPEEKKIYETNQDLFVDLIFKGLEKFNLQDNEVYLARVEEELEVISYGGFEDYFLILWDICRFCLDKKILIGFGRGSAGGCLIAYLLGIHKIDPIKFNLLFERFLTRGRIDGGSFPDIDSDFDADRRYEVKRYMEQKYGEDRVASIGTYGTFQIKAAIKDFARQKSLDIQSLNYLTAVLELEMHAPFKDLFLEASKKSQVKKFIQENPDIVEYIRVSLGQPKSTSIHACATVILPQSQSIYNTLPIRLGQLDNTELLVTEWEGEYIEKAGYLKEDILGIRQLTKFQKIIDLVRETEGEEVDIYHLPLDILEIYEMFSQGYTGDVFHIGSKGQTKYALQVQPKDIEDLIAMISLFRPGPIENDFHNKYVRRKNGEEEVLYISGTEEITSTTYGVLCYQEQIMQVFAKHGKFSAEETDDARAAMGKMKLEKLLPYKEVFLKNSVEQGYNIDEMQDLWSTMEDFSKYAFNRSHATAYAVTAYVCQYLKWRFPVQYWTVALDFADKEEDKQRYIFEIYKSQNIKVVNPDVNISEVSFHSSFEKKEIYWSLSKIRQCGEVATDEILKEREKNGEFFSLEEFLERVPKSKVNKSVVENLIFSGAFDKIENIRYTPDRIRLIKKYRELQKIKVDKTDFIQLSIEQGLTECDWWWLLLQKHVSGYAFFDYKKFIFENEDWSNLPYLSIETLETSEYSSDFYSKKSTVVTAGIIQEIDIRTSASNEEFARLLIESNYITAWFYIRGYDCWSEKKDYILNCGKGSLFIGKGIPLYNKWLNANVIQSVSDFDCELLTLK